MDKKLFPVLGLPHLSGDKKGGLCPKMGIQIRELKIPEDCSKLEWCPLLWSQRQHSEREGDAYEWLEEFSEELRVLNHEARRLWRDDAREFILDLTKKWFGAKAVSELERGSWLQLLDKLVAVDSEAGGAPLGKRTLIVFMKLGRGIPYDVVLKEEIDAEIAGKLGRATQGHNRGCKCMGCETRRTAAGTARKRVNRALKYRNEFGFATRFVSVEEWQTGERFRQMLRVAQTELNQSEVALD